MYSIFLNLIIFFYREANFKKNKIKKKKRIQKVCIIFEK